MTGTGSTTGLEGEIEMPPSAETTESGVETTHETGTVEVMLLETGTEAVSILGRETAAAAPLVTGTGAGTREIGRGVGIVTLSTIRETEVAIRAARVREGKLSESRNGVASYCLQHMSDPNT